MRYFLILLSSLFGLSTLVQAHPTQPSWRQLKQHIDKLIAAEGHDLNISVMVYHLDKKRLIYQRNPKRLLHPASNTKLFTAFAAIRELGLDYQYQTQLYIDPNEIKQGELKGDVYLKFTGDPNLTSEQLTSLLQALTAKGIHTIHGKLYLDDTTFDQDYWVLNGGREDSMFDYGTLVSAININKNTISANLIPTQDGAAAQLQFDTFLYPVKISNHIITKLGVECSPELQVTEANQYYLSGCINKPLPLKLAVQNMRLYAPLVMQNLLKALQINVTGGIEFKPVSERAQLVAVQQSSTAAELIKEMLKESDNLIANALFKTLAVHKGYLPGNWKDGTQVLEEHLNTLLPKDSYRIWDGAGGGYDYVSAQHIIELLKTIAADKQLKAIFYASLPVGGEDGTLKDRFTDQRYRKQIFAKTGSAPMNGQSALSGFLITPHHQHLAFVILINGFIEPIDQYRQLEDAICQYLMEPQL